MDSHMVKETMKIFRKLIPANGETIWDMVLVNKNSKIEKENTSVLLFLINTKGEENCMMKNLYLKVSLETDYLKVKHW